MPTPDAGQPRSPRAIELIAAAAHDDLTPGEAEEYAALLAEDGTVAEETAELRALLTRVSDVGEWSEPQISEQLTDRIMAIPRDEAPAPATREDARAGLLRRRVLPGLAAAAALVVLGGVGGALVDDWLERPAEGPPGTLGAAEPIDFEGEPADVDIEASLVAHTWGTETVLDMDGWTPGERYAVVLVGTDGTVEDSGSFLGSTVPIDCTMNGALLRDEVEAVQIRDERGRVVAISELPATATS